jgi:hypothetical protein
MAGLKKRSLLYGPAHRAQMLAEAQGGRVLALGKVGAELFRPSSPTLRDS